MKRYVILFLSILLLLSGCDASGTKSVSTDVTPSIDEAPVPELEIKPGPPVEEIAHDDAERVLSSVNAAADGGRTLRVDAVGRTLSDGYAVTEARVYEDGTLLQTIRIADLPPEATDGEAYEGADATQAATLDAALSVHDMDFDGADDLDLCAWRLLNDADPHHYFLWNADAERYQYAYTLRGAEADPERREVVASYRLDSAIDCVDRYRYAEDGMLELVSRVTEDWKRGTEDFPLVEYYDAQDGEPVLTRQEFTDYDDEGRTLREVREPLEDVGLWPTRLEELEASDDGFRVVRTEELPLPEPPSEETEEEATSAPAPTGDA